MEDPKDEALPGSPVPGALQVPSLEVSTTETSYTAASPSPEGLHSLSASVLVTTAKRQPFAHAEKMYKEDRGASHQRGGEKPTQPQREPAASPGEKPGARRRQAEAAALGRSTWPGAGRSAAEPQRRRSRWRCWKRSEPSRPDPLARLLAPTLPDSSLTPERPASP